MKVSKKVIKESLKKFREDYKLIEEIDNYEDFKKYFLGDYKDKPENNVEKCYNEYVEKHNEILESEEKRIKSLKVHSLDEYSKYKKQLKALNESKISLVKKHTGKHTIVPDINILYDAVFYYEKKDELFERCKDRISELRTEYMFNLYPQACDEMIEELEKKAFNSIQKNKIKCKK